MGDRGLDQYACGDGAADDTWPLQKIATERASTSYFMRKLAVYSDQSWIYRVYA